jgi:hypothetical protein
MDIEEKRRRAREAQKRYRERNPERWAAISRKSRGKWKRNNRGEHREMQRAHRYTVRLEILELLGGARCCKCGFTDWRALQIDHIHGNGKGDSMTKGGNTNLWSLRGWLKNHPEESRGIYQVLCANCNWIKRHESGEHSMAMEK